MSFTFPSSRLVEIELTFYFYAVQNESLLARLVVGGTSNEFATTVIDDTSLTPSTADVKVVSIPTVAGHPVAGHPSGFQMRFQACNKWTLHFPSSQIGESKSIDVQMTTTSASYVTVDGESVQLSNGQSTVLLPLIFKATALPSGAGLHVHTSGGF